MNMNPAGLLFVALGIFCISASVLDWEWFMGHRKARFLIGIIGRRGARIFYSLLGTVLVVLGALTTAGIVQHTR
jgi:hypothetical protein